MVAMRERDGEDDRMITSAVAMTARSSLHDLGTSIVAAWCEYSKAVAIVGCTCPVLHRVVETYQNGMALRFAWLLLLLLFGILDRKHSFPQGVSYSYSYSYGIQNLLLFYGLPK